MTVGDQPSGEGCAPTFGTELAAELETLLQWRRDVRHFDPRPVRQSDMRDLLRVACLAPSVGNAQPWRFVHVRTPAIRMAVADHIDEESADASRSYGEQQRRNLYRSLKLHGVREAPELLAVFCDEMPSAGYGLGIATMPETLRYSTVLAIHNLWLAARVRGIGVGWVSIVQPHVVSTLLDVPATWTLIALLCIGYPVDASRTPELDKLGWQAREDWIDRVFER